MISTIIGCPVLDDLVITLPILCPDERLTGQRFAAAADSDSITARDPVVLMPA